MHGAKLALRLSCLGIVGACIAVLPACGDDDSATNTAQTSPAAQGTATTQESVYEGEVAVTQLFTSAAAPYYIAPKLGYYKDVGLDLKPVNFTGGTDTVSAIREMGIGFASTGAGLQGVASGIDIKIVGGGFNAAGEEFIVPPDSPLRTIEDLRGRKTKVAVSRPGSNTETEIQGITERLGLTEDDVEIVYIGDINAAWTAAKQGVVDAAYSGPPLSTQLVEDGEARVWFKSSQYFDLANTISWATSDFIEENPDVIKRWMEAQQRANDLIMNDTEAAAKAYAEGAELSVPVARAALEEYKDAYSVDIVRKSIQNVVEVLVQQGALESADQINLDDVIVPGFAPVK